VESDLRDRQEMNQCLRCSIYSKMLRSETILLRIA